MDGDGNPDCPSIAKILDLPVVAIVPVRDSQEDQDGDYKKAKEKSKVGH
jgi:hypothetical protein